MNFPRTLAVVTGALAICLSAQAASAQTRGAIPQSKFGDGPKAAQAGPDVGIQVSGAGTVQLGQMGTFTLTPFNAGSSSLGSIKVTDALPASFIGPVTVSPSPVWSCSVAGMMVTCAYTGPAVGPGASFAPITVKARAKTNGAYMNCAAASLNAGQDANGANNRACSNGTISGPLVVGGGFETRSTGIPGAGGGSTTRSAGGPIPAGPIPGGPGRGPDLPPPPPHPEGKVDIGINKRGPGQVTAGQGVTFTLTAYNVGPATVGGANNITVVDTLPAGFTGIAASGGGWSCQVLGQTVTCTWTGGAIVAGASFPAITVTAIVGGGQRSYVNCAEVGVGRGTDVNKNNNKNCVEGPIKPGEGGGGKYDVGIRKTGPAVVTAGQSATFTLSPFNTGPSPVSGSSGVSVTDTLPINFTQTTTASGNGWNCIVSGSSPVVVNCTYFGPPVPANTPMPQITIVTTAKSPGGYVNCADIDLKAGRDANPRDNRACAEGRVNEGGGGKFDLSLGKRALDAPWTFPTGGTFRLTVTNTSATPLPAGSVITIEDSLAPGMTLDAVAPSPPWNCSPVPGTGLITCTYSGPLAGGGAITLDLKVHFTGEPRETYENCAKLSVADRQRKPIPETTYENNRACDKVTVVKKPDDRPDVSITKTAEHGPWSWPGGTGSYEIKIANVGGTAIPAGHTFQVTESIPAGMTFAGASGAWSCAPGAGALGPVQVVCTYVSTAVLNPGAWMVFTVQVGFNGPKQPAYNNCVQVRVFNKKAIWTEINAENNRDCEPVDVKGETTRRDLSFKKTALSLPWPIPGIRQFQLTATNAGAVAIAAGQVIRMKDTLPAGLGFIAPSAPWTCTTSMIGTSTMVDCQMTLTTPLNPGQSLSMTLNVLVNGPAGDYENCAGVAASAAGSTALLPETTFDNNNDCVKVPVFAGVLDVGIDKQGPASLLVGQTATFVLQVTNHSNVPLSAGAGLTVTDTLPSLFNPPATANGGPDWDCQVIGLQVTCNYQGGLPIGSGQPFPPIPITAVAGKAGEAKNCARIDLKIDTPESNVNNNRDCIPVVVRPPVLFDIGINKEGPGALAVGQTASYVLTPVNTASVPLDLTTPNPPPFVTVDPIVVQVTDTLPSIFNPPATVSAGPDWNCQVIGLTVTCTYIGSAIFAPGQSLPSITVSAVVGRPGTAENCALATIGGAWWVRDQRPDNNRDCVPIVVRPKPLPYDIGITKTGPGPLTVGQQATFTLTPYNVGLAQVTTASGVTVTDTLPANFSAPVQASGTDWTCTVYGPNPSWISCTFSGTVNATQAFPPITITATTVSPGGYSNCGKVDLTAAADINLQNNTSCIEGTVRPEDKPVDLSLDKQTVPGPWTSGGQFDLLITNNGSDLPAGAILRVQDSLPPGMQLTALSAGWTCTPAPPVTGPATVTCLRTLAGGLPGGASVLLQTTMAFVGPVRLSYENCALVRALAPPPGAMLLNEANLINNKDCEVVVTRPPVQYNLSLDKQWLASTWNSTGGVHRLLVTNAGATPIPTGTVLTITDNLPAGLYFLGVQAPYVCSPPAIIGPATITCTYTLVTPLAPGGMLNLDLTSQFNDHPMASYVNCATLAASVAETSVQDNQDCVTSQRPDYDLKIDKQVLPGPWAFPGGGGLFSLVITNSGTATIPAGSTLHMIELLPAGMTLGAVPSPWVCQTGSPLNCDLLLTGSLPPGQTVTTALPVTFTGPLQDHYENCARTYGVVDGAQLMETNPNNNEDCEVITPSTSTPTPPTFQIEKVVDQDCTGTPPSTLCKFIIRIFNTSQTPYTGPLTFTDTVTSFGALTGGVSLASPTPPGWTCTGAQPVSCTAGSVTLGANANIAIPLYMTINGAVPPTQNCASLTVPQAAGPSCVPMGNTHYNLGLDSNFLPAPAPAPAGQKELSYWISSSPTVANGSQIILTGSLTSSATFAPMTVVTPGWNCSGGWTSFLCSLTVVPGSFSGTLIPLKLRTSYGSGSSGQPFTYVGTVTMNGNVDPVNSNNTRTISSTLP